MTPQPKPKEKPARASILPDSRVQSSIPPIGGDYGGRIAVDWDWSASDPYSRLVASKGV